MKMLYVAAFGVVLGVGAVASPVRAEELFTDVSSPTTPFTVVNSVAVQNPAPQITLVSPNNGYFYPGDEVEIVWDVAGFGASFVNVWYSDDGGVSYWPIATAVSAYESVTWVVPAIVSRDVVIAVEATDLANVLAADYSDGVIATTVLPPVAASPITGEEDWVSLVQPGDFIVAPGFPNEVYYVNDYMERQPFLDGETLMTYDAPDAELLLVTDATLPTLPLWYPMAPKPGSVLVKFEDANDVYAVEGVPEAPFLRHLANENIAELNYGSEWKDYVMEIPVALRRSYYVGSDIVSDIEVDTSVMLKPAEIAEQWAEVEREFGIDM